MECGPYNTTNRTELEGCLYSNSSNLTGDFQRDEKLAMVEITTLSVIFFSAVVSNLLMLVAIWRNRRKRPLSRMYFFMLHLSLADLLVALFNILPQLAWDVTFRFQGGDFLCKFVKYVQIMPLYLSTYILMFMAVDRYRAVCSRSILHWNSLKVAKSMVAASWIMSVLFALPQAFIFNEEEVAPGVRDCWVRFIEPWGAKAYVTWFVVSIFGAPLLVIAICYGVICKEIWIYSQSTLLPALAPIKSSGRKTSKWTKLRRWMVRLTLRWKQPRSLSAAPQRSSSGPDASILCDSIPLRATNSERNGSSQPHCCAHMPVSLRRSNSNRITKAKMKTIKMTLVVVACFVACWAPFCITQLILVYNPPANPADVSPTMVIFLLLASLNSCTNPWIYLAFSGSLLNQMRTCLGLAWRRGNENDSIGEDVPDRRPVHDGRTNRPNHGAKLANNHPGSVRNHRPSTGVPESMRVPFIRCTRDDVAIRLKQTERRRDDRMTSRVGGQENPDKTVSPAADI